MVGQAGGGPRKPPGDLPSGEAQKPSESRNLRKPRKQDAEEAEEAQEAMKAQEAQENQETQEAKEALGRKTRKPGAELETPRGPA